MHPILFYLFDNFYIGTYGALVAGGALAGVLLAVYRAKHAQVPATFIMDLLFYSAIVGFIGARLTFILINFNSFLLAPADYLFSRQGFVFLGGIIFALPVAVIYTKKKGMPVGKIADILTPSLPLAHAFGRLGCYAAGCCFGIVCQSGKVCQLIGKSFPAVFDRQGNLIGSTAFIDQWDKKLIAPDAISSLPVIPTQLLEAGTNFLIFLVLLLFSRKQLPAGRLFLYYLLLYCTTRFGLEFLRGDVDRGFLFNVLSTSQFVSIVVIVGVIVFLARGGRAWKFGR